jgi:LytS/YehU family sensor histidine kinase
MFAALLIAFGLFGGPETWMPGASALFQLVLRSTPLYFLFVGTYYDRRIAFYDIFVKRGALVLATLTLLMLYFGTIAPLVERVPLGPAIVWLHALALFPLVVITPWINGAIGRWIDLHWLGRRFSATEATKHLFDGLQNAVTEAELIQHAETRLSEIFQAVITVTSDDHRRPDMDRSAIVVRKVPIEFQGETIGAIELGKRRADAPYLSQDLSLIGSLGGVIGSMLENVRLQNRRREQLAVEQELRLHASRSELKALRAQINPHFLFNALNAIVALIPTKPERAEETLEQLAEVFRYTLTRSDKEWTRLADEVDFVRAYLDVEKARFGERLQATIDVDPKVQDMTVPSMMLQTLVENAVKHGLSSVRGVGVLSIEAKADADRVHIIVRDNGAEAESNGRRREAPIGEGYGLRNIRERLAGHFGDRASFSLTRDRATSTTVAAIELPLPA